MRNCRDSARTIHGIPSSATFLVTPEQRRGPGQFYAKVHGSLVAEVAVAGPDFICEYDVGPSCPQLGQLVSRVKTFAPQVGVGYDQPLGSIALHGTSYRLDIRDGLGLRTSFSSSASSKDSIGTFVEASRHLLEECMPDDVAKFIKSRTREVR